MVEQHYRAPMRSRDDGVDAGAGVRRGLAAGVCGTGGRLRTVPASLADALAAVSVEHDERTARRLERFAAVPDGAVVWTLDAEGTLHRGRLAGPWTYDASPAAYDVDLVHVRACAWAPAEEAPDAVLATFARGGRNFQRVRALPGR